jgi:hypothetical protein
LQIVRYTLNRSSLRHCRIPICPSVPQWSKHHCAGRDVVSSYFQRPGLTRLPSVPFQASVTAATARSGWRGHARNYRTRSGIRQTPRKPLPSKRQRKPRQNPLRAIPVEALAPPDSTAPQRCVVEAVWGEREAVASDARPFSGWLARLVSEPAGDRPIRNSGFCRTS